MSLDRSIRYVNSKGASVEFCDGGPWHATDTDLFDIDEEYTTANGSVMGFVDGPVTRELNARLRRSTLEERDAFFDLIAYDLAQEAPGRIYTGDWYCPAYIIGASIGRWHIAESSIDADLTVLRCTKKWTRAIEKSMPRSDRSTGLNFPFNFPFNFAGQSTEDAIIKNPSIYPAPVSLRIYGPAENPRVVIGDNAYEVEVGIKEGGCLIIDGESKKITLMDQYGNPENAFDKRRGTQREGSGSYIFHKLPQGSHKTQWDGSFAFDVTVFEKRDIRRWAS